MCRILKDPRQDLQDLIVQRIRVEIALNLVKASKFVQMKLIT